jgi:hypothetical protein
MTQQQYERSKIAIESATLLKEAKIRPERYGNEIAAIVSSPAGSVILNSVAEVSSFLAGVRFTTRPIDGCNQKPYRAPPGLKIRNPFPFELQPTPASFRL